jgi:hypothetical protein
MAALSEANPLPLYAQLAALLRQRIARGDCAGAPEILMHRPICEDEFLQKQFVAHKGQDFTR